MTTWPLASDILYPENTNQANADKVFSSLHWHLVIDCINYSEFQKGVHFFYKNHGNWFEAGCSWIFLYFQPEMFLNCSYFYNDWEAFFAISSVNCLKFDSLDHPTLSVCCTSACFVTISQSYGYFVNFHIELKMVSLGLFLACSYVLAKFEAGVLTKLFQTKKCTHFWLPYDERWTFSQSFLILQGLLG